jgi:hypothetical protein
MSPRSIQLGICGRGYEHVEIRIDGETHRLAHHRILSSLWGELESVHFSEDLREVHHRTPIRWLNTEENLEAVTPEEHREIDEGRAQIRTPWDRLNVGPA